MKWLIPKAEFDLDFRAWAVCLGVHFDEGVAIVLILGPFRLDLSW